jgi:hypothetical protein
MSAPVVSWYDSSNTTQQTNWLLGTVDAGSDSPSTSFLIWNNRGGNTVVSDMTNCTITTKDNAGGNTGELVTNTWIQVKVDTLGETTSTAIGGNTTKTVRAGGTVTTAGLIKGSVNDGQMIGAGADCFAKATMFARVPATATAGNVDFLVRVAYQYV